MNNILDNKQLLVAIGTTFTAASAAAWGYLYAYRELEEQFDSALDELLAQESDKIRRFYETRNKYAGPEAYSELPEDEEPEVESHEISIPAERLATPEGRAAVMAELEREINPQPEEEPEEQNAFVVGYTVPEFDWEEMLAARSGEEPYIISKDEFLTNDAHYPEFQLTFFEGDGVLISEPDENGKEEAIPDTDQVVGDKNLQRFGTMSGNNNQLYVQNDMSEAIFCITRNFGKASVALFGPDADDEDPAVLAHMSMKSRRRSRSGDDE